MVATAVLAETRTVLEDISWQTFKAMLADMSNQRNTRLAYDNGILEIMSMVRSPKFLGILEVILPDLGNVPHQHL